MNEDKTRFVLFLWISLDIIFLNLCLLDVRRCKPDFFVVQFL